MSGYRSLMGETVRREDRRVHSPCGAVANVSVFMPSEGLQPQGCYLHVHGGGWYSGSA